MQPPSPRPQHIIASQKARPVYGSRAWRLSKHAEYLGPYAFEVSTDFARRLSTTLRALAVLSPPGEGEDRARIHASLGRRRRTVARARWSKGRIHIQAASALALASRSRIPEDTLFEGAPILSVPEGLLKEMGETTSDRLKAADQMLTALLGLALMGSRDRRLTKQRDRLVTMFQGDAPKRLLFTIGRDWRSQAMRRRWDKIRRLLLEVQIDDVPLVSLEPGERALGQAADHGPFGRGDLEVWRVSHLVFENMDERLRGHRKAHRRWREAGGMGAPPELVTQGPASRGATAIDPKIFHETSCRRIASVLAAHIHCALNNASRPLSLLVALHTSGASVQAGRLRIPRNTSLLRESLERAMDRGTFALPPDRPDWVVWSSRPGAHPVFYLSAGST